MIVTDNHIAIALDVLGESDRAAEVHVVLVRAETEMKRAYYEEYLKTKGQGGVEDRKALAFLTPEHLAACEAFAVAKGEVKRWEADEAHSEGLTRIWQSEKKIAVAAERIR
jgi:hypothetical protein